MIIVVRLSPFVAIQFYVVSARVKRTKPYQLILSFLPYMRIVVGELSVGRLLVKPF